MRSIEASCLKEIDKIENQIKQSLNENEITMTSLTHDQAWDKCNQFKTEMVAQQLTETCQDVAIPFFNIACNRAWNYSVESLDNRSCQTKPDCNQKFVEKLGLEIINMYETFSDS